MTHPKSRWYAQHHQCSVPYPVSLRATEFDVVRDHGYECPEPNLHRRKAVIPPRWEKQTHMMQLRCPTQTVLVEQICLSHGMGHSRSAPHHCQNWTSPDVKVAVR